MKFFYLFFIKMSAQIYIRLINFKCFIDFSLVLHEGLNFFVGDSGKGKTTVNKAIYFTLYGGRKFKNIANRDNKGSPTSVTIHYQSPAFEWRITRTRPSESVTVEVRDSTGMFMFKDASAQDWINKQFGIENIWLSASYIGVTKPHFLIGNNYTNADKMELLQRITYGDSAPQNQPETYIQAVKNGIAFYNERFKQLNDSIRVSEGIKQSFFQRNQRLLTEQNISDEEAVQLNIQYSSLRMEVDKLRLTMSQLDNKRQIVNYLASLPVYTSTLSEVTKRISELKRQKRKLELSNLLKDFDSSVYEIDVNLLNSDSFLYGKYLSNGWNSEHESIDVFIERKKNELTQYNKQQEIVSKNKEIEANNNKKKELNSKIKLTYESQLKEYNRILKEIEVHECKQKEIENLQMKISKLTDLDDMSLVYCYNLIQECEINIIQLNSKISVTKSYLELEKKISEITVGETIEELEELKREAILKRDQSIEYIKISEEMKTIVCGQIRPMSDNDNSSVNFVSRKIKSVEDEIRDLTDRKSNTKKRDIILSQIEELNKVKSQEYDGMSLQDLNTMLITLKTELEEISCPCCQRGLRFLNGKLIPGTTLNNSEESQKERKDKIEKISEEIKIRTKLEPLVSSLSNFNLEDNIVQIEVRIDILASSLLDLNYEKNCRVKYQYDMSRLDELKSKIKDLSDHNVEEQNNKIKLCDEKLMLLSKKQTYLEEISKYKNHDLDSCQTELKSRLDLLERAKNEINIRKDIENLRKSQISLPNLPSVPQEPVYIDIEPYIEISNKLDKPTLEIFDLPTFEYNRYVSLYNSNKLIDLDKEYKSIDIDILPDLDLKLSQELELEANLKRVEPEREKYQSMLLTYPPDDPNINEKYNAMCQTITELEIKLSLASDMKEIRKIDESLRQMNTELNNVVEYLNHFNYYYSATEELGMLTLEKRIIDINEPLKEILDSLFDEPISVKISPFKDMKKGGQKLQVNLVVEHKNSLVEDYDDECSTGQIGRISIALLLAFARNNNNPFIIIDEVLSSVEPSRQTDILDILPSYSSGKFIINICHGVAEGNAKNVINFN